MSRISRPLAIVLGVLGIGVTPIAFADTPLPEKTAVTNADKNSDINKQVGFIDLYLTDAINNAKLLSTFADAAPGATDKANLSEAKKNLDGAIDKGLTHLGKLRGYKSDLAAAAGASPASRKRSDAAAPAPERAASGASLGQLDQLERHLKEAKSASQKLGGVQPGDLSTAVDSVATHLMGADAAFRGIAKWTNYTRLQSTNLSTVPVRGDELPAGDIDRDLDRQKGGPTGATPGGEDRNLPPRDTAAPGAPTRAPGMTSPDTPVRPGATTPPIHEPTQPAPGQGSPTTAQPER